VVSGIPLAPRARDNAADGLRPHPHHVTSRADPPFSAVFDNAPDIVVRFDTELRHVYVNAAVARATGRAREEFIGRTNRELGMPEALCDLWERELLPVLRTGRPHVFDFEFDTPDGARRFESRVEPEFDDEGRVVGLVAVGRDVTEIREAEARASLHAALLDQVGNAVIVTDMEGRITYWNPAAERMYGWSAAEVAGRPILEVTVPEEGSEVAAHIMAGIAAEGAWTGEFVVRRKDGSTFPAQVHNTLVLGEDGAPAGVVGISSDLSERRAAEEALRRSEERFRQLAENIDAVFWLADPETRRFEYVSPAAARVFGVPAEEIRREEDFLALVHPDDRPALTRRVERREGAFREEYRVVRPDGEIAWLRDGGFPIRDEEGRVVRVAGLAEDVTAQRRLEEQLRQAQKMEAIGKLTGGIAHDFNNLLTAINGYAEIALRALPERDGEKVRRGLEEIRRAGERAAELTQQLLAFSRQQMLRPEVVDLNAVVENYASVLERLLGEDVELELRTAVGVGRVRVDPGQLGQVILNLAVNARDAMPNGGRLAIETRAVPGGAARPHGLPPGDYVELVVTDTGHGMDDETRARVFDPFFTTKEPGAGTGLGLSTVLGIVEQSGGAITVASTRGGGSTFRVFLPRVEAAAPEPEPPIEPERPAAATILLVEDEEIVRSLVAEFLADAGYEVLEAAAPSEALELADRIEEIDLLVSDVVMPEMNGRELATRLLERRPGLRVLYISGYTGDVVAGRGVIGEGDAFLQKPFSGTELLRRVAELLPARAR